MGPSDAPKIVLAALGCSLPVESGMIFLAPWSSLGISKAVMALQRTQVFLLFLLLSLLGLGLVQPSYGQDRMYQRFLRQHVDPDETAGSDGYCNLMMQRRKMTSHQCKRFNTFIHEDLWNIRSICTANIQCKNGQMNCHEGVVRVTDCRETGSSRAPNCRYRAKASTTSQHLKFDSFAPGYSQSKPKCSR
ncbi:ribonuclease 4-like [Cervus elaphus]|uniref:ribonuclease 4-like n=1 Tax=Cervus elaphus TaxID=9860 RepID=UPI001CC322B2|nr:ribonuclease 4-like [Cervus elaphus]